MFKPSRRAAVIAASLALGLSGLGPYAHAGLLGGDDSNPPTVEGVGLPVGGDLLGGLLGDDGLVGGLLGGDLLGGVLGGDGLLGGGLPLVGGGLPLVGQGLPLVSDVLGGDGPVGDVLGGVLGGDEGGLLAAEGVVDLVPDLSIVPGLGSVNEILEAFSESGSIVPGLQVLDEFGILGLLGSL